MMDGMALFDIFVIAVIPKQNLGNFGLIITR